VGGISEASQALLRGAAEAEGPRSRCSFRKGGGPSDPLGLPELAEGGCARSERALACLTKRAIGSRRSLGPTASKGGSGVRPEKVFAGEVVGGGVSVGKPGGTQGGGKLQIGGGEGALPPRRRNREQDNRRAFRSGRVQREKRKEALSSLEPPTTGPRKSFHLGPTHRRGGEKHHQECAASRPPLRGL